MGQREVKDSGDGKRRYKRVTGAMFCKMLHSFAALNEDPSVKPQSKRQVVPRRGHLAQARAIATHTPVQWSAKLKEQKGRCHYCGECMYDPPQWILGQWRAVSSSLVKEHMVPLSRGGSDGIDNVVGSCAPCNRSKGTMTAEEFLEHRAAMERRVFSVAEAIQTELHRQRPRVSGVDTLAVARAALVVADAR